MGFPREEYWSGLPFPPPGDLPDPGVEPKSFMSHCLWQVGSLALAPPGKPTSAMQTTGSLHHPCLYPGEQSFPSLGFWLWDHSSAHCSAREKRYKMREQDCFHVVRLGEAGQPWWLRLPATQVIPLVEGASLSPLRRPWTSPEQGCAPISWISQGPSTVHCRCCQLLLTEDLTKGKSFLFKSHFFSFLNFPWRY